jgi:SAM-dependent methyltransferase
VSNASPSPSLNADQIAYWNSDAGVRWTALQQRIDALFAPLTEAALDYAGPNIGEHVLDVGCGCGATVLELAARVGPAGKILGIDVSKVMLDLAAERVRSRQFNNVTLLLADASTHPFEQGVSDLAFSRFGVMFFDNPEKAFANIRRSLKPGGRLAFVCWRTMSENPWFVVPFAAAKPHLPPQKPQEPEAPGPFAFADPDRVRRILGTAGFSDVELIRHDTTMRLAGPNEVELAADFASQIGPVSRALADGEPSARAAAKAAILQELGKHEGPEGILLSASTWLVSARA